MSFLQTDLDQNAGEDHGVRFSVNDGAGRRPCRTAAKKHLPQAEVEQSWARDDALIDARSE